MYNQRLSQDTTTMGRLVGACILCTAIAATPVETMSLRDYTKSSRQERTLTSTLWEDAIMSDDTRDKVIVLETKVSALEKMASEINGHLRDITDILSDIKSDIAVLKADAQDNKWWIRGGLTGIFVAGAGAFWYIFTLLKDILLQIPK